jgi:adenosylcobinamide-GDP ribazoletransferase
VIVLSALRAAFALLTVLPVGRAAVEPRALRHSVAFFPLVGAVLGGGASGIVWLAKGALPPIFVGVAATALVAVVTGGLHLDGLADLFDAWGGGRGDRERMLAILRDPRTGAHGAAALVLVLLAKSVLLGEVAERGAVLVAFCFPIAGRAAAVPLTVLFPAARPDGLAHSLGSHRAWGAMIFALASATLAIGLVRPPRLVALGAALAVALALGALWNRRLGGVTGDVYGAAIELAETAFLALCLR